jgi:hypothetical protein
MRAVSPLMQRSRPRFSLVGQPVDDKHRRSALRERARDDFTDLPLSADTSE